MDSADVDEMAEDGCGADDTVADAADGDAVRCPLESSTSAGVRVSVVAVAVVVVVVLLPVVAVVSRVSVVSVAAPTVPPSSTRVCMN